MAAGASVGASVGALLGALLGASCGVPEGGGDVGFAGGVPVKEGGAEVSSARLLKSVGAGASLGAAPEGGGEVGVKSPELGGGPLGSPLGIAGKEEVLASARLLSSVGAAGASLGALLGVSDGGGPEKAPVEEGTSDVGFGGGVPENDGGAVDSASARLVSVKEGKSLPLGGGAEGLSSEKAPVPLGRGGVPLKVGRELSAAGAA